MSFSSTIKQDAKALKQDVKDRFAPVPTPAFSDISKAASDVRD